MLKPDYDLVVIGGGPSGLMAALAAAERGLRVRVTEQMPRPGLKLLVSGGGRCNLSHAASCEQIMEAFGRQGRFMAPALERLDPDGLRRFFRACGVDTVVHPDGCVFPRADSSSVVLEALLGRVAKAGVRIISPARVSAILNAGSRVSGVRLTDGSELHCRAVVLATGGRSYPGLGGSGGGYSLAAALGHEIVAPLPALVPLITQEDWPGSLAGVSLAGAEIRLPGRGTGRTECSGGILFTHDGLSGPAVLDLSGEVSARLAKGKPVRLDLCFTPGTGRAAWGSRLDEWRRNKGGSLISCLLRDYVPRALAERLCLNCGIDPETITAGRLQREQADILPRAICETVLTVSGTAGFDKAMLTRGGVSLKEVNPASLESRLIKNLHFSGELLDLDGPCGGYNLQWAFSSGALSGSRCLAREA
jgi:predicted Rossmann fold flavoprotein